MLSKPKPPSTSASASADTRSWDSINPPLSPWILDAISSFGFAKMTPVQASTIPLFLGNKDVVVEAVTGSGKTLAFLVPIIERLLRSYENRKKNHIGAIIISPTRELATQIHGVLTSLLAFHGPSSTGADGGGAEAKISTLLLLGGNTPPAQDLKTFLQTSPNLLIATPGRLNELLASPHVHCSADSFEALVLDEADRLLDLGFKDTLTRIIARLPKQRRTGLFSATVSDAVVGSLVRAGLRNPVKVVVKVQSQKEEKRTPASLEMSYVLASPVQRLVYLQRILSPNFAYLFPSNTIPQKTILYLSNCASVDYFSALFPTVLPSPRAKAGGYEVIPLHGKQTPNARQKNFTKFATAVSPSILLTTDLAARGLDIPEVDLVIQLDAPTDPKVFLHRCGRAGRAGRKGMAVLFLSKGREEGYVDFLEVRKTPVIPLTLGEEPSKEEAKTAVEKMRAVVLKDRALHEKGTKAFVSHVRAYSKHQTGSIFRVQDLEWKDLAESFALVSMPKMPELRREGVEKVELGVDLDMATYAYKDKAREKARLEALNSSTGDKLKVSKGEQGRKKKNEAWSEKTEKKETKEVKRDKKRKRKEMERFANMSKEEREKEEEWKSLVEEVKRRRKEKEQKVNGEEEFFKGFDE